MAGRRRKRAGKPRTGNPRETITINVNTALHGELLVWFNKEAAKSKRQTVVLNALYEKMYRDQGEALEDTRPMQIAYQETDTTALQQLYDSIVQQFNEQIQMQSRDINAKFRELTVMLRALNSSGLHAADGGTGGIELRPELKRAITASMRPGRSIR